MRTAESEPGEPSEPVGAADFELRPIHQRPRERLLFLGAEQLNDDELVALVLGSGAALPLARLLLDAAGGPTGLRRTGAHALCELPGLGPARVCQLKAALELGRRSLLPEPLSGLRVRRAADVAEMLRVELGPGEQEAIHVFGLDARHRIRCRHIAAIGQVDRVQVSLADIYRPLVREGMAAALVSHNHPSGEPTPSEQDRELTYRMAQVGHLLGILLLDHVVVARGGHYSFAEHGHLDSPLTLPAPRPARDRPAPDSDPDLDLDLDLDPYPDPDPYPDSDPDPDPVTAAKARDRQKS